MSENNDPGDDREDLLSFLEENDDDIVCQIDYGAVRLAFAGLLLSDEFSADLPYIMRAFLQNAETEIFKIDLSQQPDRVFASEHEMFFCPAVYDALYDIMVQEAKEHRGGYAHNLLLYLIKTYRGDVYKPLKKFSRLNKEDVYNMAGMQKWKQTVKGATFTTAALVLLAADLMGIEMDDDVNDVHVVLNEKVFDMEESMDDALSRSEDTARKVNQIAEKLGNTTLDETKMKEVANFISMSEQYRGFPFKAWETFSVTNPRITAALCKMSGLPFGQLTEREKCMLVALDSFVSVQATHREHIEEIVESLLLGDGIPPIKFDPAKVMGAVPIPGISSPSKAQKSKEKEEGKQEPQKEAMASLAEETADTKQLCDRISSLETEIRSLRLRLAGKERLAGEVESLQEAASKQNKELAALRTFAYQLTADDLPAARISPEKAREYLQPQKVVVIGGHPTWVAKLSKQLPNWNFVKPGPSGSFDPAIVNNSDFVFFFTDTLSHTQYYKYRDFCWAAQVPFGYLHGVNIEATLLQAYNIMNDI